MRLSYTGQPTPTPRPRTGRERPDVLDTFLETGNGCMCTSKRPWESCVRLGGSEIRVSARDTASRVVLALPEDPVRFRDRADPDDTVEASVVLLLLARDSDGYALVLSNLANLVQNPEFVDAVLADDPDRILDRIEVECL